jgi:hypothetical protein
VGTVIVNGKLLPFTQNGNRALSENS